MAAQHETSDARIVAVITDLQQRISAIYPDATFDVFGGEDPKGTYLRAVVDIDDPDSISDLVIDPLLDLQVEQQLPLYFVAARPTELHQNEAPPPHPQRPRVQA